MPAETDLRGDRVAYLHIPPGDTTRTFMRVRGARGGKSRVVVTGFAAEGESYRVSSPVLDGRYVYWLSRTCMRNEFFAGRGRRDRAARRSSSPTALFPGTVDSIARRRARGSSTRTARASSRRPTRLPRFAPRG